MASLIGTLGAVGSSLLGNLLQKGVTTLGDVASSKIDQWAMNKGIPFTRQQAKQINVNTNNIQQLQTKVQNIEQKMEIE